MFLLDGNGTSRHVTRIFNATHRTYITHDVVPNLVMKFKMIGSVVDASRSGRQKTSMVEGTSTHMLEAMARSPTERDPTSLCANGNQPKQCLAYFAG
ncbi:hypothetical protein AVEN_101642-1 [Araneus ventricosus]|uniref:DUF4817 domain-containing protein n=1 Tax=Araneus ventricosus TaxID=182803 RepID=A0A4Y2EZL3_ARAVE|nr:hypothetical protein AVEN_101642-1 [Araneus ventricosus]